MKVALGIFVSVFVSQAAFAENAFYLQQANWSVSSGPGNCIASSRPFVETNISPVAAARFLLPAGSRDITLETYFWPGAFKEGQKTTLTLVKGKDREVIVPATATSDYAVMADRPFTREEMKILRNEQIFGVKAENVSSSVGVDATAFALAYSGLLMCVRFIE